MNSLKHVFRRRRIPAALLSAAALLAAGAAYAAEEGAVHGGGAVPWKEILKELVNFLILVGVLVYFLRKPLAAFLHERTEQLRKSIADAASARAEAAEKLSVIESRVEKLADEVARLNAKMDEDATVEARALHEAAAAEIARIRAQAEFTGEQEVRKAREELRKEASILAGRAAEEIVRKTMSPADQERLFRENLEQIEEILR